jgi:hypothetical protein
MNTTGLALNINDTLIVRVGDEFVNPKGARIIVDGFTKSNQVRFTFVDCRGAVSPTVFRRSPDAFLGHIQREQWTRSGGN